MSFFVDSDTLRLYIFLFRVKFRFQWYAIWILFKKPFLKALFWSGKEKNIIVAQFLRLRKVARAAPLDLMFKDAVQDIYAKKLPAYSC